VGVLTPRLSAIDFFGKAITNIEMGKKNLVLKVMKKSLITLTTMLRMLD